MHSRRLIVITVVSVACLLALPVGAHAAGTWTVQSTTNTELVGVFPIDANNVWAVGGESLGNGEGSGPNELTVVRHTTNGGGTWAEDAGSQAAEALAAGHELKKVFFLNANEGWIIGEQTDTGGCNSANPSATPNEQQIILHTTDGGTSWTRQTSGTCSDLEDIYMLSPTLGYITSTLSTGEYLKYNGSSWVHIPLQKPGGGPSDCQASDGISFPPKPGSSDRSEGWIVDTGFSTFDVVCILHTTDGGSTWTRQPISGCTETTSTTTGDCGTVEYMSCLDTQHCWAGSEGTSPPGGFVFRWDGASWIAHKVDPAGTCNESDFDAVAFADPQHGFTGGEGKCPTFPDSSEDVPVMFSTGDGGLTWSKVALPGNEGPLVHMRFADPCHGWAVGERGAIFAYSDPLGCLVPSGPPPGPPPAASVARLVVSPNAFRAASSGPSATAARSVPVGTLVTYSLNVAANVKFTVRQKLAGRIKGKGSRARCAKPSASKRSGRRCTRVVKLRGSFSQAGKAGANRFHFTGRLANRKLKPGSYVLVGTPAGGAGAATTSFRIIR